MTQTKIGKVTHYFTDISVAIIELSGELEVGDEIQIVGKTTDFKQTVDSMEIEEEKVEEAGKGDSVGLKVKQRVREGDEVFLMDSDGSV